MDNLPPIRLLAISGSLRRASSNSALVGAVGRLAPDSVTVSIYQGLAELPPFNPDLVDDSPPEAVSRFRDTLLASDAVLIASPEYAHGVPGVVKNALDWVVASGELIDKPVALINAAPRATLAWTSLANTLSVMSARVILDASITVPLQGRTLDTSGIVEDLALATALSSAIDALASAARGARAT